MKDINTYINEYKNEPGGGSSFENKVKYSKSDWEKWKKETKEDIFVGNYDDDPDLELAYIPNHKEKTMKHIATYNIKTGILWCDDIKLFGHEE